MKDARSQTRSTLREGRRTRVARALFAFALAGCSGAIETAAPPREPEDVIEAPDTIPDDEILIEDTREDEGPELSDPRPTPAVRTDPPPETIEAVPGDATPPKTVPAASKAILETTSFPEMNRSEKFMAPVHAGPPVCCDGIDRLVYYRRGSAGICGPVIRISIGADGSVSLEKSSPDGAQEGGCLEPMKTTRLIEPARARSLMSDSCREYNDTYQPGVSVGCEESSRRFYFFSGDRKLFETMSLPCESGAMVDAEKAMAALMKELD